MEKLKRVVIKEELVAVTGDTTEAIILNQFLYWSERVKDFDELIQEENEKQLKYYRPTIDEEEPIDQPLLHGWIYKTANKLKDEIMSTDSESTINRKINSLVSKGFIVRRNNPNIKYDRTYQYRINFNNIIIALLEKGYILQDYKIDITKYLKPLETHKSQIDVCPKALEIDNRHFDALKMHGDGAIPEITIEINKDIYNTIFLSPENDEELNLSVDNFKDEREKEDIKKPNEFNRILENSNAKDFEEKYINPIQQAIRLLYYSDKSLRIGNMLVPPSQVREDLKMLKWDHIDHGLRDFKIQAKNQEIQHPIGYLSRCIYNAIFQGDLRMESELLYHDLL